MRLINIWTLELETFFEKPAPAYFILSHRWGENEVSLKDYAKKRNLAGPGYEKIVGACKVARMFAFARQRSMFVPPVHLQSTSYKGVAEFLDREVPPDDPDYSKLVRRYERTSKSRDRTSRRKPLRIVPDVDWIWIDTCCIDKRSTAELSEAINSMYTWYKKAEVCIVHLSDVRQQRQGGLSRAQYFRWSSWFTRGWTLQELLGPSEVVFCDAQWQLFGHMCGGCRVFAEICESPRYGGLGPSLLTEISQITGISKVTLTRLNRPAHLDLQPSVAQIMSWASTRQTTRREDEAYCLLGLLHVNMPLIYGEGGNAFRRLQEEIVKRSRDQSIFAWRLDSSNSNNPGTGRYYGLLADSPQRFLNCNNILFDPSLSVDNRSFAITNNGIELKTSLYEPGAYTHGYSIRRAEDEPPDSASSKLYVLNLNCKRFDTTSTSEEPDRDIYPRLPNVSLALVRASEQSECSLYMRALGCDLGEHSEALNMKAMSRKRIYLLTWMLEVPPGKFRDYFDDFWGGAFWE